MKLTNTHKRKMLNRVKDRIKLNGIGWRCLLEDFKNKESKNVICAKYNIPSKYFKWVKKIIMRL